MSDTYKAVEYTEFGGPDVLTIVEKELQDPAPGEVQIKVAAAGLNPVDYKIFRGGPVAQAFGAQVPSGVGNDLAGVVEKVGDGVTEFTVGQEVFAGKRNDAIAEYVNVAEGSVLPVPEGLDLTTASTLWIAARTAAAAVKAANLSDKDTVYISAAAGGVGVIASQLALETGAKVIGSAGERNQEFLKELGVIPVTYGEGEVDRIKAAAADTPAGKVTAVIDLHGPQTIQTALDLDVPTDRIVSIATYGNDLKGAIATGGADASNEELEALAKKVADGSLVIAIDSTFPLEDVAQAYQKLEGSHVRGKIAIVLA